MDVLNLRVERRERIVYKRSIIYCEAIAFIINQISNVKQISKSLNMEKDSEGYRAYLKHARHKNQKACINKPYKQTV